MATLFSGPGPLAQLVWDELHERGVGAEIRHDDPMGQLWGSAGSPAGWQSVLVPPEVAERQRAIIDEVLALVSAPDGGAADDAGMEEAPHGGETE